MTSFWPEDMSELQYLQYFQYLQYLQYLQTAVFAAARGPIAVAACTDLYRAHKFTANSLKS